MNRTATPRRCTVGAALVFTAAGLVGSALAAPASAAASVPKNVHVQCSGFYGPNTEWPHHLTGCARPKGATGSGQTNRTGPGTETITWDAPFVGGESMDLVGITHTLVNASSPECPADHPVEVDVAGTIGAGSGWADSPVTATICSNATDFVLRPGTFFVIAKVS